MSRIQTIDELFAASIQSSGEGAEATAVTADIVPILEASIDPQRENLIRADKGLGRSRFGIVRGGNESGQWSARMYVTLDDAATPVGAPPIDQLLQAALGATPVSINTTVNDVTPTAGVFDVASATGIQVGDILTVLIGAAYEMRPVTDVTGTQLTFSPAFTAAPANGAAVKARIYRLATAPVYLTLVNWLRNTAGADTDFSRKALDAIVGEMVIDFNQSIVEIAFSGPAPQVYEGDTYTPAIPSLPTFSEKAQARNFGTFYWGATEYTAYELQLTLSNGSALLPVGLGQTYPDGAVHGQRAVSVNLLADGRTENDALRTDSIAKTERALFFHIGDGAGTLFGVNLQKAVLSVETQEKGAETLRIRFGDSGGFASSANGELVIAVG